MSQKSNTDAISINRQQILTFILDMLTTVMQKRELPPEAATLSLRQLGVSSMGAIALQYRIDQFYGQRLTLETLLSDLTLNSMAQLLAHNVTTVEIIL